MNIQVGKSAGIALLMAAALLAALFAMGVFSTSGVGADGHVTAVLTDGNDPATPDDQSDDTLTITVTGLSAVTANADNEIRITTLNDLATTATDLSLAWGGGTQFAETITGSGNVAYEDTAIDTETSDADSYVFDFADTSLITAGEATITISLAAGARIDSNTRITGISIGHGAEDAATRNQIEIPEGGIGITGAPTGPSITLTPDRGAVQSGTPAMPIQYHVTITGINFTANATIARTAITALQSDGTTTVGLFEDDSDATTVSSTALTDVTVGANGTFTKLVEIEALTAAETITISVVDTPTTGSDTAVMAMFYVNTDPEIDFGEADDGTAKTEYDDLTFAHDGAPQMVDLKGTDADSGDAVNLDFSASSSDESVATAEVSDTELVGTTAGATLTVTRGRSAGTATITVSLTDEKGTTDAMFMVTVAAPPAPPQGDMVDISSMAPGATVQVTVKSNAAMPITVGQDVMVDLAGFGVPSSISGSDINIESQDSVGMDDAFDGSPVDVVVNGSKITITVPNVTPSGADQTKPIMGNYSIRFKQSAGITNPASAGMKTIKWVEDAPSDADANNKEYMVTIQRVISLDKKSGTRGTMATATLKGFANGTATVKLNGDNLGEVAVADNVGMLEIDTTSSDFVAGENAITAVDASGEDQDVSATFTIKPKVALDPEETSAAKTVKVKLSDWTESGSVSVTLGGVTQTTDPARPSVSDGKAEFTFVVPADANRGTQTVKVSVGDESATASLKIDVLSLTVSPSMAVPGQQVTVSASGFTARTDASMLEIKGIDVKPDDARSTSSGAVTTTFEVPLTVGNGTHKIELVVDGRPAVGELEVPKPSISLDPDESVPGSVISVTGSGFAANERVEILYGKDADSLRFEDTSVADGNGNVSHRLTIPSSAGVGADNMVKVQVRPATPNPDVSISATADHSTPGPAIVLPDQAQVGTMITISGTNFAVFTTLDVRIGTQDVTPASGTDETDKNGAFEVMARVPRINAGSHTVTVTDNSPDENSATESFTVVTTAIVSTPEEVFGVLGDSLVSVWSLDNATKAWSAYFPGAPEGVSDLTGVKSGDIVWINVNADVAFQGGMLNAGWNLISLE